MSMTNDEIEEAIRYQYKVSAIMGRQLEGLTDRVTSLDEGVAKVSEALVNALEPPARTDEKVNPPPGGVLEALRTLREAMHRDGKRGNPWSEDVHRVLGQVIKLALEDDER